MKDLVSVFNADGGIQMGSNPAGGRRGGPPLPGPGVWMRQTGSRPALHWSRTALLGALLATLASLSLILATEMTAPAPATPRPARWAEPVRAAGLPNFFQVSDTLYRGAQPTRKGFAELRRLGIRTVVNLRAEHSDLRLIQGLGLNYETIPMNAAFPKPEDFRRFLAIARDPARQPVFVHCQHGSDRTGTAVALYRVAVQGWDREEAIREMTRGGYGFHGIYFHLRSFIREFQFPSESSPQPAVPAVVH
jgi:protein tyrosine phosphatase (PTP) superfamily phosphohydrolase (DUF442 family)